MNNVTQDSDEGVSNEFLSLPQKLSRVSYEGDITK